MIGFGELRKRASEWKQDISEVERLYTTDWLLKSVFDNTTLAQQLALRGASALRFAHAPAYSLDESPEFAALGPIDPDALRAAFEHVARSNQESGLKFALADFKPSVALWEYVGPLGRRSAAQPHIRLSIIPGTPLHAPVPVLLVHRFTDACVATVTAVSLEELAAERIIALAGTTVRARDAYDLWFILTQLRARLNDSEVRALVKVIARAKNVAPLTTLALTPTHRETLARRWDAAIRRVPHYPTLEQVERDLEQAQDLIA